MRVLQFKIKAYYKCELATLYGVSIVTLRRWLNRVPDLNLQPRQQLLTPDQVSRVVQHLGEP